MFDRVKDKAEIYILSSVVFPLVGVGFFAVMDDRHEGSGEVKRGEIRTLQREITQLENYLELAPKSEYTASRKQTIRNLEDEIKELERDLK